MVGFRVGRYTDQNLTVECARDVCIVRDSMKEALGLCEQHIKSSKFNHYCPATYEVSPILYDFSISSLGSLANINDASFRKRPRSN